MFYFLSIIINSILNFLFILSSWLFGIKRAEGVDENIVMTEGGAVKLKIYTPQAKGIKPVIIYHHGGGWVIGGIYAFGNTLRYLSHQSGSIIVMIVYQKAPRMKFPHQIDQCKQGYQWIKNNIVQHSGDTSKIVLMGDSAGGNLLLASYSSKLKPKAIVLIYPLLDVSKKTLVAIRKDRRGKILNLIGYYFIKYITANYLKNNKLINSKFVSVNRSLNKINIPKTFVLLASHDPLNEQISQFCHHMIKAKQPLEFKKYSSTLHGFITFNKIMPNAKVALDDISTFIKANV